MVLDHDVSAIIRVGRYGVNVDHFSIGNGAHLVERLTVRIAVQGANVDSFMKTGINNATCGVGRIAHKTVLPAFPRR